MDQGPDPRFPPQPADLSRIVARGLSPGEPWELFLLNSHALFALAEFVIFAAQKNL
jgi:hypothetical protein